VVAFGHLLRDSGYARDVTINDVIVLAEEGIGSDFAGYRREFMRLLDLYRRIA